MYAREIIQTAKEILEQRRARAESVSNERHSEVYAASPEIARIDAELRETGPMIFKTAIRGGDIAPIRARNEALMKRRGELLRSLGHAEDYTDAPYTCARCSDTGYADGYVCQIGRASCRERVCLSV